MGSDIKLFFGDVCSQACDGVLVVFRHFGVVLGRCLVQKNLSLGFGQFVDCHLFGSGFLSESLV